MKKCKFYSKYDKNFGYDVCRYDRVKNNTPLVLCTHKDDEDNCPCFEPYEEGVITAQLITDKDNTIDERTLTLQNCDKIILTSKCLEVEVKIEIDNFNEFDYIVINGIKFRREK